MADSDAPPGAAPTWLPNEHWVNERWVPFDEARLYGALRMNRVQVAEYLNGTGKTLRDLASARGVAPLRLTSAIVPRLRDSRRRYAIRLVRTQRAVRQSHLSAHLISHATHIGALLADPRSLYGVPPADFTAFGRAGLSRAAIAQTAGVSTSTLTRRLLRASRRTGRQGVARGAMSRRELRDRQAATAAHLQSFVANAPSVSGAAMPAM